MADNKRFYWLKLQKDFFGSLRIKKLRKLPCGDTGIVIYLKMQLHTLSTKGVWTYKGTGDDFAEEVAYEIDESEDAVRETIEFLISKELLVTDDNINYTMPYVNENTSSECESAQRMRQLRGNSKSTPKERSPKEEPLHCNTDVTQKEEKPLQSNSKSKENNQAMSEIIEYLNEKSGKKFSPKTKSTMKHITARIEEGYTVEDFKKVIDTKCKEWMGTQFEKFLRPDTLFRPTNFESYVNQKVDTPKSGDGWDIIFDIANGGSAYDS